ncbi:hypothetical protein RFI_38191 [Reticulomyxa filosa]|uniref:Uncharacterized protein n=1 Tax=Reticulomyxa filosa TaxID=46433 RepID=X6LD37_RETFI|nr:hypothetical protein RFI_38191 [Reticulomyxa filosa]|eukprot:ETN99290.1 hypothetical protein RFI_38191 [Reticulomyxa filosa]
MQLIHKQIRSSFLKGLSDIGALVLFFLLIITVYRLFPLCRDIYRLLRATKREGRKVVVQQDSRNHSIQMAVVTIQPPSLRFGLGVILEQQIREFGRDLWITVSLSFWSFLIIVTLVRLFEFITELIHGSRKRGRSRMTLKLAAKIAQDQAQLIWGDFYQIFTLLFAWKTYKFAIASLVFATLLPAGLHTRIYVYVYVYKF